MSVSSIEIHKPSHELPKTASTIAAGLLLAWVGSFAVQWFHAPENPISSDEAMTIIEKCNSKNRGQIRLWLESGNHSPDKGFYLITSKNQKRHYITCDQEGFVSIVKAAQARGILIGGISMCL